MENINYIGKKIKELRKHKRISIKKLSEESKVSRSYISDLERGIYKNPSIEILRKIAPVLEVNISDLFDKVS